jgi:hypothetical protein
MYKIKSILKNSLSEKIKQLALGIAASPSMS